MATTATLSSAHSSAMNNQFSHEEHLSPTEIRHQFSQAMSTIYRAEVPLYSNLLNLVADVNKSFLDSHPDINDHFTATEQHDRLHYERHGAIRLGTAEEMNLMARFMRVMGMQPVGYYDLSQASLPVHATCFRCLDLPSLTVNPFRVFCSLLRPELISETLKDNVYSVLSRRQIFSPRVLELLSVAETAGGLSSTQAMEFISQGLETFKWRSTATVKLEEYKALHAESPLLADVVAFPGPHINHLTPRTLDIDAVQAGMATVDIPMKEVIEGPPARECPILLRQTSFKALEEAVYFPQEDGAILGSHTARFGEVEQRGVALTEKGRTLYDQLIQESWEKGVEATDGLAYADIFRKFPDTWESLRKQNLAWFRYYIADSTILKQQQDRDLEGLLECGAVTYEPIVYEDFLPLSAAGIFQSNLGKGEKRKGSVDGGQGGVGKTQLGTALNMIITDEMTVYRDMQQCSIDECLSQLT